MNGPKGPVSGATVRVEHLVGDQPPPIDVVTGPDGRWDLPNIAGGRYRVRAFMAPLLAQTEAQILFLNDGEQSNLDLNVESFSAPVVVAAVAPDPPQLNKPLTLVVRVARKTVDADGSCGASPSSTLGVALTQRRMGGSRVIVGLHRRERRRHVHLQSAPPGGGTGAGCRTPDRPTGCNRSTLELSPCGDPRATSTTLVDRRLSGSSGPPSTASGPPPN